MELERDAPLLDLLVRLQKDYRNQQNWADFVTHVTPNVLGWCRARGLQDADAQDVMQNVLLRLAEKLRDFRYDPRGSFRAWLKTLAHHAVSDLRKNGRRAGRCGSNEWLVEDLVAGHRRMSRQNEEFDEDLLEKAMLRVRPRVAPRTWQAFTLTAIDGLSGAEASPRIPMHVPQVFVAKRRVLKMLREEVARLENV